MSAPQWICSIETAVSGDENMRRDVAMARQTEEDGIVRVRFYTWEPWTLSLGHNQSLDRIDVDRLVDAGYNLVRRPTGGRAVFHAEEITYGVAMPTGGRGIHETYGAISAALKSGFERLGADGIEFSRTKPDFREHYGDVDSEGCFSAAALNELTWNGRKVVGSAQRRYGSTLLQHGSILTGPAHLQLIDFLSVGADVRQGMKDRLAAKTATLEEIVGTKLPPYPEIGLELARGFMIEFGSNMREVDRVDREWKQMKELT